MAFGASGCAGGLAADSIGEVFDDLEQADLVDCDERREPLPDLVTCEDDERGDLTILFTDTELDSLRASTSGAGGPWILGDGFVVVSYDDDIARVRAVRDHLGAGELFTIDDAGDPVPLP